MRLFRVVTGVQTCALPISPPGPWALASSSREGEATGHTPVLCDDTREVSERGTPRPRDTQIPALCPAPH